MDLNQSTPILADGAMGTLLYTTLGLTGQPCFEALNLTHPDAVAGIHTAYLQAGAQLIKTNSFGASRTRLAAHGLADQVHAFNLAAARLARQAVESSGRAASVLGSLGPLGARLAPYGRLAPHRAEAEIAEQVEALCSASVDALLFETHLDLAELLLALRTARGLTSIPIFASLTFTRDDCTLNGDSPATAARELHAAGADVVGANCSEGPSQLLRIASRMRRSWEGPSVQLAPTTSAPAACSSRAAVAGESPFSVRSSRVNVRLAKIGIEVSPRAVRSARSSSARSRWVSNSRASTPAEHNASTCSAISASARCGARRPYGARRAPSGPRLPRMEAARPLDSTACRARRAAAKLKACTWSARP